MTCGTGVTADTWDGEIYLGRIGEDGTTDWEFLCRHDSSLRDQDVHPHPRMTPDGGGVVFTSDHPVRGTVFELRLAE